MRIACPICHSKFEVPEKAIGKTAKCPKCQVQFTIEGPKATAEAEVVFQPAPESRNQIAEEEVYYDEDDDQDDPESSVPKREYALIEIYLGILQVSGIITVTVGTFIVISTTYLIVTGEGDTPLNTMFLGVGLMAAAFFQLVVAQFIRVFLDLAESTQLSHGTLIRIAEALEERGAAPG